jgi:hypothetical protein
MRFGLTGQGLHSKLIAGQIPQGLFVEDAEGHGVISALHEGKPLWTAGWRRWLLGPAWPHPSPPV